MLSGWVNLCPAFFLVYCVLREFMDELRYINPQTVCPAPSPRYHHARTSDTSKISHARTANCARLAVDCLSARIPPRQYHRLTTAEYVPGTNYIQTIVPHVPGCSSHQQSLSQQLRSSFLLPSRRAPVLVSFARSLSPKPIAICRTYYVACTSDWKG